MARRPRSTVATEPRGSVADPRAIFVPTPDARQLVVVEQPTGFRFPTSGFQGALVWVRDSEGFDVEGFKRDAAFACAAAVRVLPREAEDAPLPARAGSPAVVSGPSEVRPVVAELLAAVPEGVRAGATERAEQLLASVGL